MGTNLNEVARLSGIKVEPKKIDEAKSGPVSIKMTHGVNSKTISHMVGRKMAECKALYKRMQTSLMELRGIVADADGIISDLNRINAHYEDDVEISQATMNVIDVLENSLDTLKATEENIDAMEDIISAGVK